MAIKGPTTVVYQYLSFPIRVYMFSSGHSSSKIGHDFSNKVVQKMKFSINHFFKTILDLRN